MLKDYTILNNWINIININIDYSFIYDGLSTIVIVPVGIITLCVLFYAQDYMKYDPNRNIFYIILSIFGIFMSILVLANNYLVMFIGWEFVGVISYLLISFWSTRIAAMKAALSAILLNRFGDTMFMIVLGLFIINYNTLDFSIIKLLTPYSNTLLLTIISILLIIAATAKSAQLGLHSWLLSAMEGPTPVSALLHAATMVCAGIYVLCRSYFIIEYCPTALIYILILGGFTTLISGLIAIATNDIKKVIALSTMSQLSIMILAIGISSYELAIYHLYCHAFFKALLFMSAGSIIHSLVSESQDMRVYGSLINYLPFTYSSMLIASLSLMAIPGLSGYYSKDIIIESLYGSYTLSGYLIYYLALTSATLTSIYSIRVIYLTFYNNPKINKYSYNTIHESYIMMIPMLILIIYSIFIGYKRDNIINQIMLGLPNNNVWIETEYTLNWFIKLLPLILGLSLSIYIIWMYEYNYNNKYSLIYNYLNQRIYFDQLLNNIIIRNTLNISGKLNYYLDNGLLKILGPLGISRLLTYIPYFIFINLLVLLIL
uniref:NADH-ubiquinone oxidoreductase chain 5 n=1 Tax=[Candida] alai TaxID=434040 RepID=E3VW16_9ASCO|nr:NADH dehydrogenase subunit 5 [[Candida] alai]ADO51039.1 NADH dehydrogenase subunit 5 [[Candida] alai]